MSFLLVVKQWLGFEEPTTYVPENCRGGYTWCDKTSIEEGHRREEVLERAEREQIERDRSEEQIRIDNLKAFEEESKFLAAETHIEKIARLKKDADAANLILDNNRRKREDLINGSFGPSYVRELKFPIQIELEKAIRKHEATDRADLVDLISLSDFTPEKKLRLIKSVVNR